MRETFSGFKSSRWSAVALMMLLCGMPLRAQSDPPPDDPIPEYDPGTDVDASADLLGTVIDASPMELYVGSPEFLFEGGGDTLDYVPPGGDPTFGATDLIGEAAPLNCGSYAQTVTPLKIFSDQATYPTSPNTRYFSYLNGPPMVLVGASADAGCVFPAASDQCNISNYESIFSQMDGRLNKVRVWVSLAKNSAVSDVAFRWDTAPTPSHFLLDAPGAAIPPTANQPTYQAYFDRLLAVVNSARAHHLFVEVTFFAPWEGPLSYANSPWLKGQAVLPGSTAPQPIGFSDLRYFVVNDPRSPNTTPAALNNERMRAYQANIIQWTVNTLWCFDNVYWEIANEPELATVDPNYAAVWQNSMIYQVRKAEATHYPALQRGHLIAVQPFTRAGLASALGSPSPLPPPFVPPPPPAWQPNPSFPLGAQIINGHYTLIRTDPKTTLPNNVQYVLNLGAVDLIRTSPKPAKLLGFNEDKISGLAPVDDYGRQRATKSHTTTPAGVTVNYGGPEPARAEAWEFLLSQGSTFDHYAYLGAANAAVLQQMGNVLAFFNQNFGIPSPATGRALRLSDFLPATVSSWGSQLPAATTTYAAWDTSTKSQRYWTAMETDPVKTARRGLVLYAHHSTPRCSSESVTYDKDLYPASGCSTQQVLSFGGYDARIRLSSPPASPPMYQVTFAIKPASGTFVVSWLDPATLTTLGTQTLPCPSGCTVQSPPYSFDILLRIYKQ